MTVARSRIVQLALVGALLLLAASCSHSRASHDPKQAVQRFFAAYEGRNCDEAKAITAGHLAAKLAESGCKASFDEFEEHGTRLLSIVSATRDGRDHAIMLVTVQVELNGKAHSDVVSVRLDDDRWKVISF